MTTSREIHLKAYPTNAVTQEHFALATVEIPALDEKEVLIKNLWMSIDAGQRTLMQALPDDLPDLPVKRFKLGEPMEGQAIGQIVESRHPAIPVGTIVTNNYGWREYAIHKGAPDGFELRIIDKPADPIQSHLHINSVYGATAYYFITHCAQVKAGETVWISTAAGTTGSIAAQIAKICGCKVVGTTSTQDKVEWLKDELKLDVALSYRDGDLRQKLKEACPEGIDVFIDFVGGEQLEIAISLMNTHGRIVKAGETSSYDGGPAPGPKNLFDLVLKRVDLMGRTVFDLLAQPSRLEPVYGRIAHWVTEGRLKVEETVYEGIENAPLAQIDLFAGKNIGKMLVKLGEPESL